jgi:hypothetical protein
LVTLLHGGGDAGHVASYLVKVEREWMGLRPPRDVDLQEVSEFIVDWYEESIAQWKEFEDGDPESRAASVSPDSPESREEARYVRARRMAEMKALPYSELARFCGHKIACEVLGRNGVKYAHETYVFYDDKPGGLIRVLVDVWAYDFAAVEWTDTLASGVLLVAPGEPPDEWRDEAPAN